MPPPTRFTEPSASALAPDANQSEACTYLTDRVGRVTAWTERAAELKGYSLSEAIGLSVAEFYCAEDRADALPEEELLGALESAIEVKGWRIRKDQTRFWASSIILPLRDSESTLIGFARITRPMSAETTTRVAQRPATNLVEQAERTRRELFEYARNELEKTLTSITSHLEALRGVVQTINREPADRVVAKLTILELRLEQLALGVQAAMTSVAVDWSSKTEH